MHACMHVLIVSRFFIPRFLPRYGYCTRKVLPHVSPLRFPVLKSPFSYRCFPNRQHILCLTILLSLPVLVLTAQFAFRKVERG
jgi:hypothetical protein